MSFTIRPMLWQDVKKIAAWCYEEPYTEYNGEALAFSLYTFVLFRPLFALLGEENFAVDNQDGELAGFFQFIRLFQHRVTIGLGMRPDLTGHGQGLAFVEAGIEFGKSRYHPLTFGLTVRVANQRAFKVYSRAGFQKIKRTISITSRGLEANYKMQRDA
ncbi:MAG TPA: GNAT family N-acetyltransferase [Ktedonobacteraceae bacterium]|nr:GNAT family N-acetyltransferase [Ktedonobacteraceae bacterium]